MDNFGDLVIASFEKGRKDKAHYGPAANYVRHEAWKEANSRTGRDNMKGIRTSGINKTDGNPGAQKETEEIEEEMEL